MSQSQNAILDRTTRAAEKAWGFFDRVCCISLGSRPDRRRSALAEFERVGLAKRVQFVPVDKHPTDSEQGIFESHMACLRAALAAGMQHILVFEDDIQFHGFSHRNLSRAARFLRQNPQWDLFFLGCWVKSSRKTRCPSVVHVRYLCAAHAYAINRAFAERLVQMPWRGVAFDDLLRSMKDLKVYAAYPAFAFQHDVASDNDKMSAIHRFRRFVGNQRLQKLNEFSRRHVVGLIASHVAAVLIVLLILRLCGKLP
jgi:GR25 family glycosyltransferase involved in LPS biosynthesis